MRGKQVVIKGNTETGQMGSGRGFTQNPSALITGSLGASLTGSRGRHQFAEAFENVKAPSPHYCGYATVAGIST